ncbi:Crp/Fnr family transcriptional regulator [Solirhodobacter olei]|uniref:Crp/Fnr family transcriptional regulator n=1 Tax=Solirhodobacter olei TaxID=2493082 RepID=UPI0013E2BD07|nr:Crp/Fnr family transcriptional regulator [Solirhodobacter olei]
MPKALLARVAEASRIVECPANHRLWDEDVQPGFTAILWRGYLRMPRYSLEGRRQIVSIICPGEIVGEGVDTRPGYGMEAVTAVTFCRFERGEFRRLADREPELRRALLRQHMKRLEVLRWLTWSLGLQTPEERLCAFLARACETMPYQPLPDGSGILSLEVPRADVADLLGTTKETISRLTHRLQQIGLIEIRDPRHFRIFDRERLAKVGGLSPARPNSSERPGIAAVRRGLGASEGAAQRAARAALSGPSLPMSLPGGSAAVASS